MNTTSKLQETLLFICLLAGLSVVGQNYSETTFEELKNSLERNFANDFEFSVLVEFNDEIVFSECFGYRDTQGLKPIDKKTLFNIASITKSITAVGIMKLVEQNKIELSNTLVDFFEDVPEDKKVISISKLLSHKSGLRQSYPLEGISDSEKALKKIFNEKLEFTPGEGFRYSNQNYQLLALIIEKVVQTTYEDYIRKEVLIPMQMDNTYFWDEANVNENIAPINSRIGRSIGKRNWAFIGSGGVFTTTTDLLKFWNGFYKNGFLSKESIESIFGKYYETSSGIQIGLGFFTSRTTNWKTPELWSRGTESWGHNAVIRYFPENNTTIIVTTNSGEIDDDRNKTGNRIIGDLIADLLFN